MQLCLQALEGLSVERKEAWGNWLDEYRSQLKAEGRTDKERRQEQDSVNPCYVPRNQVMQEVIREAEAGNYQEVRPTASGQRSESVILAAGH